MGPLQGRGRRPRGLGSPVGKDRGVEPRAPKLPGGWLPPCFQGTVLGSCAWQLCTVTFTLGCPRQPAQVWGPRTAERARDALLFLRTRCGEAAFRRTGLFTPRCGPAGRPPPSQGLTPQVPRNLCSPLAPGGQHTEGVPISASSPCELSGEQGMAGPHGTTSSPAALSPWGNNYRRTGLSGVLSHQSHLWAP